MQLSINSNLSINTTFKASKKYAWKKEEIKNPKEYFNIFEKKVIKNTKQNNIPNKQDFYEELSRICKAFQDKGNIETVNKCCKRLAETLVSLGNNDLAGVIYSKLLKLNPKNKEISETCAQNAKKSAHRTQDWVHNLARCCDLRKTYINNPNKQTEYRKNLYETKNCLQKICSQYEEAKKHYKNINRPIRSIFVYKNMLASVYNEIAEVISNENKTEAKKYLEKAFNIFNEIGNKARTEQVAKLLKRFK